MMNIRLSKPLLYPARVTTRTLLEVVLISDLRTAYPINDRCGAVARLKINKNHFSTISFDKFTSYYLFMPVVSTFDQDRRMHDLNQFERCLFRKDNHEINRRKRRKNSCSTLLIHKWSP